MQNNNQKEILNKISKRTELFSQIIFIYFLLPTIMIAYFFWPILISGTSGFFGGVVLAYLFIALAIAGTFLFIGGIITDGIKEKNIKSCIFTIFLFLIFFLGYFIMLITDLFSVFKLIVFILLLIGLAISVMTFINVRKYNFISNK